jgi:hypothetical protein
LHEADYCSANNSPHMKDIAIKRQNCPHKNTETIWDYIPGEAVKQPDHELCTDCGQIIL